MGDMFALFQVMKFPSELLPNYPSRQSTVMYNMGQRKKNLAHNHLDSVYSQAIPFLSMSVLETRMKDKVIIWVLPTPLNKKRKENSL